MQSLQIKMPGVLRLKQIIPAVCGFGMFTSRLEASLQFIYYCHHLLHQIAPKTNCFRKIGSNSFTTYENPTNFFPVFEGGKEDLLFPDRSLYNSCNSQE